MGGQEHKSELISEQPGTSAKDFWSENGLPGIKTT